MIIPSYKTEEFRAESLIMSQSPPITGYSLLVTLFVLGFGLTKAVLAYRGMSTALTTLEWVFGVVVTDSWVAFTLSLILIEAFI